MRTTLLALLGGHLAGILTAFIGAAVQEHLWGRRNGLDAETADRMASRSTSDLAFWGRQPYAGFLEPVAGALAAPEPRTPSDYVRAVSEAAGRLTGPAREVGTEAVAAARQLLQSLDELDREVAVLARDASPAELAAVEQKLGALGAPAEDEPESRHEMRRLVEGQRDLLRRLGHRLEAASQRRARLMDLLRSLWLQLANLRAAAAADAIANGETTGRIRAVLEEVEDLVEAGEVTRLITDVSSG